MSETERLHEVVLDLQRALKHERELRLADDAVFAGLNALTLSGDADGLLPRLFTELRASLGADNALLAEPAADGSLAVTAATAGVLEQVRFQPGSLFTRALAGEPVAVFDVARVAEWREQPEPVRAAVTSALHIPVQASDGPGVLVYTHAERGMFSQHHLDIARRLTPLVSQALLNLRLERAIRERDRFFTLSLDLMCIITFDGHFKQLSHGWEDALGFTARAVTTGRTEGGMVEIKEGLTPGERVVTRGTLFIDRAGGAG